MTSQKNEFALELASSYTANKLESNSQNNKIHQHLNELLQKLNKFELPLSYDGSETIKLSLQKVINMISSDVNKTYFGDIPAHVHDAENRLIETLYFHYKYSQKNTMKITTLLQRILFEFLNIKHQDLADGFSKYSNLSKYNLGKKALVILAKDDLIEQRFWEFVGPEAHVNLKLLDAKLYYSKPENAFVRRHLLEMHQSNYNQKINELTEKMSAIRLEGNLSAYTKKQKIIELVRAYQSKELGKFATKLDSFLIEAERHVHDYFQVT